MEIGEVAEITKYEPISPMTNLSGLLCTSQLIIIEAQKVYLLKLFLNVSTELKVNMAAAYLMSILNKKKPQLGVFYFLRHR